LLESGSSQAYTESLLRGLVAAYLDLLGDTYPRLQPTHYWKNSDALGVSVVGNCEVRAQMSIVESDLYSDFAEVSTAPVIIVTWNGPTRSIDRNISICTLEQLLTGTALRNVVMEGTLWRPCLTKLVQAYNFLVDSQCVDIIHSLRIVGQPS